MTTNLFYALELAPATRAALFAAAERWRVALAYTATDAPPPRWYDPDDYHVTLKFLGPQSAERDAAFIALGETVAAAWRASDSITGAPPLVAPRGLGAFPSLARPSVLWAGVAADAALPRLAALLDAACAAAASLGVAPESRPYRPHVTLARCRSHRAVSACDAEALARAPGTQARRFALMRTTDSQHRGQGQDRVARYAVVRRFHLSAGAAAPDSATPTGPTGPDAAR